MSNISVGPIAKLPPEVCAEHISAFLDNFSLAGFSETCHKWYATLIKVIKVKREDKLLSHIPVRHRAPALFLRNFNVEKRAHSNITFHARIISILPFTIGIDQSLQYHPNGTHVAFCATLHDNTSGPNNVMKGTFWNWCRQDYDYINANINKMFIFKGITLSIISHAMYGDPHFLHFSLDATDVRHSYFGQYFLSDTPRLYAPPIKRTRE